MRPQKGEAMSTPVKTLVTYHPKEGKENELLELVRKHWPALSGTGLVTDEQAVVYRAWDKRSGKPHFVEIFSWRDERASSLAHQTPEVMAVWEPMGLVMDSMTLSKIEEVRGT
jgi:glycerol kinase